MVYKNFLTVALAKNMHVRAIQTLTNKHGHNYTYTIATIKLQRMAKRVHWTTQEISEEELSDEEPVVDLQEDWLEVEEDRVLFERNEPCMEGSDEEFSDLGDLEEDGGNTAGNIAVNNTLYIQQNIDTHTKKLHQI